MGTVKYLIEEQQCNPLCQNNDGSTPLHFAAGHGKTEIVEYLITKHQCEPQLKNRFDRQPLHWACQNGHMDTVKYLIEEQQCNPLCQDNDGSIPLHFAAGNGKIVIVKYLITTHQCDPEYNDNNHAQPLHWACENGHLDTVKYFIEEQQSNTLCQTNKGNTLLHFAAGNGKIQILKYLLTKSQCDPQHKNRLHTQPLHWACENGHMDIVKYLIEEEYCNPLAQNYNGSTPLQFAAGSGKTEIVEYLITKHQCDPHHKNRFHEQPLHWACENGHLDMVKYLIEEQQCNPASPNFFRTTPLGLAFEKSHFNIVNYIVTGKHCKLNAKLDKHGNTSFHFAADKGYLDIIKFLSNMEGFDVTVENINGSHPLHFACRSGHVDVVKYLLSHRETDITKCNALGYTPMMCAAKSPNSSQLLSLFAFFGQSKSSIPLHKYVKVGILGHPGAGKTTLSKVIAEQDKADFSSRYRRFFAKDVSEVENCTVGIIPSIVRSKKFGSIIVHDFAGQPEYYSSHTSILETLCCNSSVVIVIVIDISDKKDVIKHLHYWMTFIKQEIKKARGEIHIIVTCSHNDQIDIDIRESSHFEVHKTASELIKEFGGKYVGFVAMDCRKLWSKELIIFLDMVSESCYRIQSKSPYKDVSIYCHLLYLFLVENIKVPYCTLSSLKCRITNDTSVFFPTESSELSSHLLTLEEIGLLFFIVNKDDIDQSWIIVQKEVLLSEVSRVLFPPTVFKQYRRNIASNTGVVTETMLKQHFHQYDSQMLITFLIKMGLCQELESFVLKIIINNLTNLKYDQPFGKVLFFPTLIDVEKQDEINEVFDFGLCFQCDDSWQFSISFLQVLQLNLAYKYAIPNEADIDSSESSLPAGISRKCCVWKNGILWTSKSGIKTVIEVTNHCKTLLLVMAQQSSTTKVSNFALLRSELIKEILDLLDSFCPSAKFTESILHSEQLETYPRNTKTLSTFNIVDMFKTFVKGDKCMVTESGSRKLDFDEICPKDPYFSLWPSCIKQLFDDSYMSKTIPTALFRHIQNKCGQLVSLEDVTYESVRRLLDHVSIFTGRNPFALAKVDPDSIPPLSFSIPPLSDSIPTLSHAMSDQTLTVDDLSEVLHMVEDVTDWITLGLHLGLKDSALETVDYKFKNLLHAKREMLKLWLKQDTQVTAAGSEATRKSLLIALRIMKEDGVLNVIEEEDLDTPQIEGPNDNTESKHGHLARRQGIAILESKLRAKETQTVAALGTEKEQCGDAFQAHYLAVDESHLKRVEICGENVLQDSGELLPTQKPLDKHDYDTHPMEKGSQNHISLQVKNQTIATLESRLKVKERQLKRKDHRTATLGSRLRATETQLIVALNMEKKQCSDAAVQANYLAVTEFGMKDVKVCGEKTFEVTAASEQYIWERHGFQLTVPNGALPSRVAATVAVRSIICGPFELPENSELIGAIYWVSSTHTFKKKVTVHLQHCAIINTEAECNHYKIILGKCSQDPPYKFAVKDGVFTPHSQTASISVTQFSIFGTICTSTDHPNQYTALIYHKQMACTVWRIVLVVVQMVDSFVEFVQKKYRDYIYYHDFPIQFEEESESIIVEMSPREKELWHISSIMDSTDNVILKRVMDGKQTIPSCHFFAEWKSPSDAVQNLVVEIKLTQKKNSQKTVTLFVNVSSQPVQDSSETFSTQGQGTDCQQGDFMNKVAAKIPGAWYKFGVSLGIDIGKLEAMEQSYPKDQLRCFSKVYYAWKQERVKPLTWEVVVEILRTDVMAEKDLSSKLAKEYNLQ